MTESFITEIRPADVLLGRGSGPNDHEGNIRFRQLVQERKDEYLATNHRLTKGKIAQEIVDQVFARNGRFLRKLEGQDASDLRVPDGVDAWVAVDEDTIMEKAKQALRQNTQKTKAAGQQQSSTSPVPSNSNSVHLQHHEKESDIDFEPIPFGLRPPPTLMSSAPVTDYRLSHNQQQHSFIPDQAQSSAPWYPARQVSNNSGIYADERHHAQQRHTFQQQQQQQQHGGNHGFHQPPAHVVGPHNDDDPDSMLALLRPPTVISTYSEAQQQQPHAPSYNNNMFSDNRRGSMTMNDLAHAHVHRRRLSNNMSSDMNVSDIMDSMSKLSVHNMELMDSQQQQQQQQQSSRRQRSMMYASSDTMGTIEDFNVNTSMADMSFATVDTSTFSAGYRPTESASSQSGSGNSDGKQQNRQQDDISPSIPKNVFHKGPGLDRNDYSAMSGNLGVAVATPPNLIRPEGGARRRGRRTSIDMNADENHDILESAEYIYHQSHDAGGNGSGTADNSEDDMPRPGNLVKAPSDISEMNDLGASSLSFKSPFASTIDMDMNSALFETLPDSDFK